MPDRVTININKDGTATVEGSSGLGKLIAAKGGKLKINSPLFRREVKVVVKPLKQKAI